MDSSGRGGSGQESPRSNSESDQSWIFPGVNEFDVVKGADTSVRRDIAGWEDKADDYVFEFFDNEMERVYGTRFGDNLAMIADIAENALAEPETFRGVRDKEGRLQAGAIVHRESDRISVDFFATVPWNILQN